MLDRTRRPEENEGFPSIGSGAAAFAIREIFLGITNAPFEIRLEGIEGAVRLGVALGPKKCDKLFGVGIVLDLRPLLAFFLGEQEPGGAIFPVGILLTELRLGKRR